jgi:hypothetical protein
VFAWGDHLRDNFSRSAAMLTPANLFRLLSEFIVLLLGALMILLAITGRVGLPARPIALVLLAILFIYSAMRAWMRREPDSVRLQTHIRAGSLALVGALVLGMTLLPLRFTNLLLGLAGGVLALRGLLGCVLFTRQP